MGEKKSSLAIQFKLFPITLGQVVESFGQHFPHFAMFALHLRDIILSSFRFQVKRLARLFSR